MINLHLAIGDGDIPCISFENTKELLDYIQEIKSKFLNRVWLFKFGEVIIVTEDLDAVYFNWEKAHPYEVDLFLQEYSSYQEAYSVALDMREDNPLCYS